MWYSKDRLLVIVLIAIAVQSSNQGAKIPFRMIIQPGL